MVIVAEPADVMEPSSCPMIGVIAVHSDSTRTDTSPPLVRAVQACGGLVHAPVGAVVASQLMWRCASVMSGNGDTILFAAVRTSVRRAARVAGQTGPPAVPQRVSVLPTHDASTDATRAPSRAAWESVLFMYT